MPLTTIFAAAALHVVDAGHGGTSSHDIVPPLSPHVEKMGTMPAASEADMASR